ncbi:MAG: adenylate/guanylate cyclase domain-containing protein, partial [Acidiferrobacterales bacterium]
EEWLEGWRKEWGGPYLIEVWAPSMAEDERFRQWWAKYLRLSASPAAVINVFRMNMTIDVRAILPTIHIPTLVLHRVGDRPINVEEGQYLAEHIPGAKFVELTGEDHLAWVGDSEAIVNEIQEFLTGERPTIGLDRVLATVLLTDIVDSTKRAAEMGDRRWRDLLDTHNTLTHKEISRFRGRAVRSTGDGILATFDGPARAIHCALAIGSEVRRLGIEIRAGLHTGECEVRGESLEGLAIHIAARVSSVADAGEILVSRTVKDLVSGSGIEFEDFGIRSFKGVPDEWQLFKVVAA